MAVNYWLPGKSYPPNSIVQANTTGAISQVQPTNAGFESGDQDWTKDTNVTIDGSDPFEGSFGMVAAPAGADTDVSVNDDRHSVLVGQVVTASCQASTSSKFLQASIGITFYDSGASLIDTQYGVSTRFSTSYTEINVVATAPINAVTCSIALKCLSTTAGTANFDNVVWDYFFQTPLSALIFKATQVASGYSGTVEPVWPTVATNTVVDNEVTWEAVTANRIIWEANPILISDSSEPTWPTSEGASVADNTILWLAESQRVQDANCPNTKYVAIAASKIFCGDDDIVAYSATVNPLDWTTANDAGFIPFGMNTYGSMPVTALGIYRSNLVVFNSKAFQMWQVDEDPANMALLDAIPIGCPYYKSGQPVSNDYVFLTEAGIRSMGIAGANASLQAGTFGKQIDPLVLTAIAGGEVPDALYFPGAGQYWLFFGEEAFVLTMNGGKADMSWSRYVFPSAIDDWTILGTDLILRSGLKIWRFDPDELQDDAGGADVTFAGEIWWPYLDFGALGQTKMMIGFDTVATGAYAVVFGYNQNDDTQVTTSYAIADGDTLVGDIIPMPISAPSFQMRLTFTGNTAWEWSATTLYLQDWRRTS